MAAGDITIYSKFLRGQVDGSTLSSVPIDFDNDTLKLVILKNTFTPDTSSTSVQEHFDDISAFQVATGTSYTGPITLANVTLSYTGDVVVLDADDVSIVLDAGSGFTDGRWIVIYKDSGTASTSPLFCVGDLGADQDISANSLNLLWASTGIINWVGG